ncbi:MAG: ABC transporter permease subunit [Candidatus Limnocylindrales bacterium]|jgi:ABC-2 type transport system permease protein
MLLRNVFTKTVRDLRWPTFWVALGMGAMTGYFALLFPTYAKIVDLNSILDKMGPAAKLLGASMGDASTLIGFLHIELFSMILPALMVTFAAGMASGFTAAEESRGTIDVLLSYPVSRRRLVLEKTLAVVLGCVVSAVVVWVFAIVGAAASASVLPGDKLAAALVMMVLIGLDFGAIALSISAFTGNRGASIGIAVALMVVMYLVDALANIVDSLGMVRPLSLFRYYMGGDPLRNGLDLADAGVLAAVALVFLVVSVIAFERRDLAA